MKQKTIIIVISLFFACLSKAPLYSQIKLSIDSIRISYVVDSVKAYYIRDSLVTNGKDKNKPVDLIDEDLQKGPHIFTNISIENQSKDSIILQWSEVYDNSYYQFYVNNKVYHKPILLLYHLYDYPVTIPSGRKYTMVADTWLFLGTDIYRSNNFPGSEYNKEVIEALPTLQFVLKYNGKTYKSCGIKKVIYVNRDDE